jgi:ribokinase
LEEISKISEETKIAFNPRQKNIKEDAKKVADFSEKSEIFFLNKDEAIEILDRLNIETEGEEVEIIRKIKDFGTKIAVITDGIRGAWAMSGERIFKADSIVQNRPIDSTGAGDAFSSGFMAAYLKEKSIEECLKWGIANGGKAVNFYGGVKGLLGEEEIIKEAEKVKVQKL